MLFDLSDLPRGVRRCGRLGAHVQVDGEPLGREVRPRRRLLQGRLLSRLNVRPAEMNPMKRKWPI